MIGNQSEQLISLHGQITMLKLENETLKEQVQVCNMSCGEPNTTWRSALGDFRKYPYPTTGGMSTLTSPCPQKFQNAHPPLALQIPKSLTPPPLRNFPVLFQTLWNSCSTA